MRMEPMLVSYSENSQLQASCQTVGNPLLAEMAAAYASDGLLGQSVRIAEYGCSGGRNSREPFSTIMSTLRAKRPVDAECVLEDLPSNPWHQVMEEVPKLTSGSEGMTQILCAGTSFFNQACAAGSVDLGFSYVSAHFLSKAMPLTTHVLMHEAVPTERTAWDAVAASDWERFLLLRARELKKGGKAMLSTMSRDSAGYSWQEFSNIVWNGIQVMHAKGAISKQEVDALVIPACLRSEEEVMAPFKSDGPVGSCLTADLLEFARTEVHGERELPAPILATIIRRRVESVWGGMFIKELHYLGRNPSAAQGVMDEVWNMFEEDLARDPTRGWLDMRCFYLQITKK